MSRSYRFGLIGMGNIAKLHAEQIGRLENCCLAAVSGGSREKAGWFTERYRAVHEEDYHSLLGRDDIDIVNICTPSGLHADIAIEAVKAGKHVIVEKPIDVSLEKADALIEAAKTAKVKLSVISQRRFDKSSLQLKQQIDSGMLGRIVLVEAAVNWYRPQSYYDSAAWRGTKLLDGGALMNQSIHTIDLMLHLAGPVRSVFAKTGTLAHERIDAEDIGVAVVSFENGAFGTIAGTTVAYPGFCSRLEIFGTEGSVIMEADRLTQLCLKSGAEPVKATATAGPEGSGASDPNDISGDSHLTQFLDMLESIEQDREPLVNGDEGRRTLELIEAIYRSAETRMEIHLPLSSSKSVEA